MTVSKANLLNHLQKGSNNKIRGKLNGGINKEGFGLTSTASRLGLLFGNNAKFEIHDTAENIVEAKVSIPVQYSI